MSTFETILVANRGEIALRIIRGAYDHGLRSVAVYADQDRKASFAAAADDAYALGGRTPAETYLDGEKILDIAARSGADAIHPGYGFLAEDGAFAQAVVDAGLVWIGPSAQSISALGDKVQARLVAKRCGVSPVPGTDSPLENRAEVEAFIAQYGYPVVLKRADGGGGRGISVIHTETDLDQFFSGRDEESLGAFFVERFVQQARHVETQCGRDQHGNFVVYSTRDCSVQRRHQKLIEEAPAPFLPAGTDEKLFDASRRLFEGVDYVGLGTCEFLLESDGSVYFLEVNPRLQVEHTVTEEVSGVDLVGQQFLIAQGGSIHQPGPVRGHSIELRLTSEDPRQGLTPSLGCLTDVKWPTGPGIRIDTGVDAGDEVAPDFDSMIAKLIVTGENRSHALRRARRAMGELVIKGVGTPVPLYQRILDTEEFSNGEYLGVWTRWLEERFLPGFLEEFADMEPEEAKPTPLTHFVIEINGQRHDLAIPTAMLNPTSKPNGEAPRPAQPLRGQRDTERAQQTVKKDADVVASPLQAIVVRVCVELGQSVAEGDLVMVLESMKMEKYIHAHRDGQVEEILTSNGANVSPNQPLIRLAAVKTEEQQ